MNKAQLKAMKRAPPIECGSCHACCHQLVALGPDDLARRPSWQTEGALPDGRPLLKRRPDGSCVYLDPLIGCSIYANRPDICRVFHCGLWLSMLAEDDRRATQLYGDVHDQQLLAAGERHKLTRKK